MTERNAPTAVRLLAVAIGGFLYGFLTAHLPAPHDATLFWLGNLGAPYLLIPFIVGAWRFRAPVASAAGALAAGAVVAGFYNLPAARNVGIWFRTFLLGDPGGRPWLTIAIMVGLIFGHLGFRWHHKRARFAGALVAMAFIAEPLVHVTQVHASRMRVAS